MTTGDTACPATVSVTEAARILGISRSSAYRMTRQYVDSGGAEGIPALRLGARVVVPYVRLMALLNGEWLPSHDVRPTSVG